MQSMIMMYSANTESSYLVLLNLNFVFNFLEKRKKEKKKKDIN